MRAAAGALLIVGALATSVALVWGLFVGVPLLVDRGPVRSLVWEFPAGYRGWVVLRWGDPTCPPLPVEDGRRVVRVGASGRACTSDLYDVDTRFIRDDFVYVHPDGARTPLQLSESPGVWGGGFSGATPERPRETRFVGTKEEFERALRGGTPP